MTDCQPVAQKSGYGASINVADPSRDPSALIHTRRASKAEPDAEETLASRDTSEPGASSAIGSFSSQSARTIGLDRPSRGSTDSVTWRASAGPRLETTTRCVRPVPTSATLTNAFCEALTVWAPKPCAGVGPFDGGAAAGREAAPAFCDRRRAMIANTRPIADRNRAAIAMGIAASIEDSRGWRVERRAAAEAAPILLILPVEATLHLGAPVDDEVGAPRTDVARADSGWWWTGRSRGGIRDLSGPNLKPLRRRDAVQRLHAQYAATRALAESASLLEAAPRILEAICETLGWQYGALWRLDSGTARLVCLDLWHGAGAEISEFEKVSRETRFARGAGLPGRVWESGEPAWIRDVVVDPNFPRAKVALREGLHGALGFPILIHDELVGVLEFASSEVAEPDDELMEMLATIGIQIGQFMERKRTEGELATLFRLSRDMLCVAGVDGYFHQLNPAWEATLGFTEGELKAQPYMEFVHPEDREATVKEAGEIAAGHKSILFENRYRCKDGSYKWLSWNATPMKTLGLIYCTVRDVTEQKRAAEELRKARTAAEIANEAKSAFLANMSHEIRTPMNAVVGLSELLANTPMSADQREYTVALKDSAESLLSLIDDIIDFSKIEAGKLELSPTRFALRDTLGAMLRTLGIRAHKKGLELLCRIAPEVPDALFGDSGRLRQVIVNLVGNAIKFTDAGEVLVDVELKDEDGRDVRLLFEVSDTGVGVARNKQALIFEAFEQADSSITREYGGTGLGLAIAARLVAAMGGEIELESEPERGSRFRFTVLFRRPASRGAGTPRAVPELADVPVMVVDDNASCRRILAELLTAWGMRPQAVAGAHMALQELEAAAAGGEPLPVVLLDANMPEMDGFALAAALKRRSELAGTWIMMLSSARPGDRARAQSLGVVADVTKPISQPDLLRALTTALGSRPDRSRSPDARDSRHDVRRLRVLIAEDNAVNQLVAVGMLESAGHTASVVENGKQALEALERERFDLLLLDLQMPELDGFETTLAIREKEGPRRRRLPIVAVTAHALKADAERCFAAGMDGFLTKPLDGPRLFDAIKAAMEGRRAQPRAAKAEASGEAVDADRLLKRVGGEQEGPGDAGRHVPRRLPEAAERDSAGAGAAGRAGATRGRAQAQGRSGQLRCAGGDRSCPQTAGVWRDRDVDSGGECARVFGDRDGSCRRGTPGHRPEAEAGQENRDGREEEVGQQKKAAAPQSASEALTVSVEVLDEDDLVLRLVVEQLVDARSGQQEPESSRSDAFLLAHVGVLHRVVGRVADGRVLEALEAETVAGIRDAVEEHAPRPEVGDPDALGRVEPAAPLDGVHQQLPEGLGYVVADLPRQVRVQIRHEIVDLVDRLSVAGHEQLDPVGLCRHDLDRRDLAAVQDFPYQAGEQLELQWLLQVALGVLSNRFEQRFWSVVRGHHYDLRAPAERAHLLQDAEAVDPRHADVEEHQVVVVALESLESGGAARRGVDAISTLLELQTDQLAGRPVIIDDEDSFHAHGPWLEMRRRIDPSARPPLRHLDLRGSCALREHGEPPRGLLLVEGAPRESMDQQRGALRLQRQNTKVGRLVHRVAVPAAEAEPVDRSLHVRRGERGVGGAEPAQ